VASSARAAARSSFPSFEPFIPVWRLLTSVRFAVFYIAVLALFGLLGVVLPQIPEPMRGNEPAVAAWVETQRATFGFLTDPMHRLGLFSVYQAKWFLVALGFLVVNVTVCTFNRWSPTFRNAFKPPRHVPDTFFDRAHNRTALTAAPPEQVESTLRKMRYRTDVETRDGATYVFADRYPWAQLATFISHMALILFLAGGLVSSLTGFTSDIFAGEGTTTPVFAVSHPNQIQVRIDEAVGIYGERGNALDFRTHLTLFHNGEEVASGYTTVNDPLEYGGYRFHQVAFFPEGIELRVRDAETGNAIFLETFPLQDIIAAPEVRITDAAGNELLRDVIVPTDFLGAASGTLVGIPDTDRVLWAGIGNDENGDWELLAFDPRAEAGGADARIPEEGAASLGDLRIEFTDVVGIPATYGLAPPASDSPVLIQLVGDPDGERHVMITAADQPTLQLAEGEPVVYDGREYTFLGTREFAGISVKRDPGAWFIWSATAMLLIGLAITFYVPRRRLWLKLTRDGTYVAALAEKSGGFEKEMRRLAERTGLPVPHDLQEEER
jgi:cytochrome c biogenesis protein